MKMLMLMLLLLSGCGKEVPRKSSSSPQQVSKFYSAAELKVKVFYEMGAEPYVSDTPLFKYWTLLEKNLLALFQGRRMVPHISIPKELSQMQVLTASEKKRWSVEDVLKLSRSQSLKSDPATFEIYFLNGRAAENENIIGFHINDTRIIAIFKEVIRSTASGEGNEAVPKYVEQSTLIHEMGHALGLVNNGVPMKESHQDPEHGAHCSNPNCVMYWANEGTSGMMKFALGLIKNHSTVMFDDKCLQDTRSY